MALLIRRNTPTQAAPADPYQWARELLRWDPFREMESYATDMDRAAALMAPFEVKETKDSYVFKADVPGVKEQDLDITLTGNRLVVNGKREAEKEENTDTYYARERSFGSFTRSFTLPEGADGEHVRAELKDGVLTLVLPKKPELQPKKISVKAEKVKA
ncbi:MAG TPA: HSP20 family small heat-shock protein [Myxococcales bacterium]|jgi:HSP20 family protein|nr:HSP20 family small heat-shock protein [Myxococcales bacterium]